MEFPPEVIETERLRLRRPTLEDAGVLFETYMSEKIVTEYLAWTPHETVTETAEFLQQTIDAWDLRMGHRAWVIERKTDSSPMGTIGSSVSFHRVEVGFALGSAFWGSGYMPEALVAVCDAAFSDERIARVQAMCDVENIRSARVLEKAGMLHEGTLRRYGHHPNRSPDPRDCLMYAITKAD